MELQRAIRGTGPADAKILFVDSFPRYDEVREKQPLCGYAGKLFTALMQQAGLARRFVRFESVIETMPPNGKLYYLDNYEQERWKLDLFERIKNLKPNVIVPLGELPLNVLTDKTSIDKWQLSILPGVTGIKTIPMLCPRNILKTYKDIPYLIHGLNRVKKHSAFAEMPVIDESGFLINSTYSDTMRWLDDAMSTEYLSVDIETSKCQISCVGLGTSPTNVISIPVFPDKWSEEEFHEIFKRIDRLLATKHIQKILQNGIYDISYFAKYGITVNGFWHDTMLAQKFLYPELRMGLDYVARIFTERPYWKDEGSDWRRVADWDKHYLYNCKDVAGTFDACFGQRRALAERNLQSLFDGYIMPLTDVVKEMCFRGLPVHDATLREFRSDVNAHIETLTGQLDVRTQSIIGKTINPRSPKQVKELLSSMKIALPVRQGKTTTDKKALKTLAIKYPKEDIFSILLDLSKYQKMHSSYLNFAYDDDGRMRYTLNVHGTETGRFSCYKDPFDKGVNAQTIPKGLRKVFKTTPNNTFIQVDLAQAEARFVAWDAPEPKLIQMYIDGEDIHRFVASRLFDIAPEDVTVGRIY